MKLFLLFLLAALSSVSSIAQKPDEVLATATGHKFTIRDLSAETQAQLARAPEAVAAARTAILEEMINQRVVGREASAQNITIGRFIANEKAKIAPPTEAEIKEVFDNNSEQLGKATLSEARTAIVNYLQSPKEQKAVGELIVKLRAKYPVVMGKGINTPNLQPADTVATIGGSTITAGQFEKYAAYELFDVHAQIAELILGDLDETVFNALVADEAKSLGIDSGTLIAREITNKMKDFTDDEREKLNADFAKRLNDKYKVTQVFKVPLPPVETVSVDDDPSTGAATSPVTIIMFSDFQCSACSALHPLLKEAMAAYPGKIRFVVRDFPLESIHDNSLLAARAAAAANVQGKFFDYIDILYKNQTALDAASLAKYAAGIGLNAAQFDIDFKSEKILAEIKNDIADGEAMNITSTPTIFVNGRRVDDLSVAGFKAAIDQALGK